MKEPDDSDLDLDFQQEPQADAFERFALAVGNLEAIVEQAAKEPGRKRPWFAERYTLRGLVLAILAFGWTGLVVFLLVNGKEVQGEVWVVITAIITFYFKGKEE